MSKSLICFFALMTEGERLELSAALLRTHLSQDNSEARS